MVHLPCAYVLYPVMRIGETMSEKSKKNAKELRKAWTEFLKEQEKKKNAKQKEQETVWQSY